MAMGKGWERWRRSEVWMGMYQRLLSVGRLGERCPSFLAATKVVTSLRPDTLVPAPVPEPHPIMAPAFFH